MNLNNAMRFRSVAILCLLFPVLPSQAQEEEKKPAFSYSAGTAAVLAFSGVNANLTAEVRRGHHGIYLGPKISVADAYLPGDAPAGVTGGYKFFFDKEQQAGKFSFFLNLDYQLQVHQAFRTAADQPKRYNTLHELNAGYGLQYNISDRFAVNNVLAFGRYLETFRNSRTGTNTRFDGFNRMIKLQLIYRIR